MLLSFYALLMCLTYIRVIKNESLLHETNAMQQETQAEIQNISLAVWEMLRKSFIEDKQKRVFNFYAKTMLEYRMPFFADIMDATLQRMSVDVNAAISVRVGINSQLPGDNERHYGVLFVDSKESLSYLYRIYIKYHLHISGDYIILLHTFQAHYQPELFDVSRENFIVGVLNANVLIYASTNLLLLFTTNYFTKMHYKLRNFYGCPLICATWEHLPYFAIERDRLQRAVGYQGIEGKLLEYLAEKMNFTLKFYWMSNEEIYQTLDDRGVIFDKFFSSGFDFALGAFPYKPSKAMDPYAPTTFYYLSRHYFVTSSDAEYFSPFAKLLFPFVPEIWSILLIIFICGIMTSAMLYYFSTTKVRNFIIGAKNTTPVYNMFVVSLGGMVTRQPGRNFARFLLLLWLLVTLVLRCAYQAFMYHYIKADIKMPLPNTVHDLVKGNYMISMTESVYDLFQNLKFISNKTEILNGTEIDNFPMLKQQGPDNKRAILTAIEYFGYFKRLNVDADLHMVQDKFMTLPLCIYMRKNSVLLSRFNEHILNFINVGLMQKWSDISFGTRRTGGATAASAADDQPQVMNIRQLYGAINLLAIGIALSTFVFLLEFIIGNFKSKCTRNIK